MALTAVPPGLCVVGLGTVFDAICGDPAGHGLPGGWTQRRAAGTATLASHAAALLDGLDPARVQVFVAVDEDALNYARLELYGAARLRGLRMLALVHARAVVAPDARLGDNCWVAAGALVGQGAQLLGDVLLHPKARVDAGARIGLHAWIGPGASIGAGAELGQHCVIGADVQLRAGTRIGRHCVIDQAGPWRDALPDGSFRVPQCAHGARIVGAGYSFEKPQR